MSSLPTSAMEVQELPIDDLRQDPFNPRKISDAQLSALTDSIREFGFVDPVIARREDKTVVGGHQRLLAARRLGLAAVPVVLVDLPWEQSRLLSLALNRIQGDWDEALLSRLLVSLDQQDGVDLKLSGFESGEIDRLLKSIDADEARGRAELFDLDAALLASEKRGDVKPGQLWALGEHRLICADSTDAANVDRLLGDSRPAMAFCDPPYNVNYGRHGGARRRRRSAAITNDALAPEAWAAFVRRWAKLLIERVDGAVYICMSTKEWPVVSGILEEEGGHWSDTIIWAKDRFVMGRADYHRQYEPIWYGWRAGVRKEWHGGRSQSDVWSIARPSTSDVHPTMKPLELVERAIENSTEPASLVLDLFLGSGTTLIAAERTGRVCYASEVEPRYCIASILRWESFTGERAVLLDRQEGERP